MKRISTPDVMRKWGLRLVANEFYGSCPAPEIVEPSKKFSLTSSFTNSVEEEYADAVDQLKDMGRFIDVVPPDGNCMFESIARQIKRNTPVTAQTLRESVYNVGKRKCERFIDFYEGDKDLYFEDLERLRQDGTWDVAIGDLALSIAQVALGVQIIVIRSFYPSIVFPDNNAPISENAVVIVQNASQTHYDATKLLHAGQDNDSAVDQMRKLNRRIVAMPQDDNSFFNAVSNQLEGYAAADDLKRLVCTSIETNSEEVKNSRNMSQILSEDYGWNASLVKPAMEVLAERLGKQIVMLADYTDPIVYPTTEKPISADAIILVQDRLGEHFDSTKTKGKIFYDNGPALRQMKDLNRCLVCMPNDDNSFFNAISYHLSEANITSEDLRLSVCNHMKNRKKELWLGTRQHEKFFLNAIESLEKNNIWSHSLLKPVMKVLAERLKTQIVVLEDYEDPIFYPESDGPIFSDAIVLIHDRANSHFDATKNREKTLRSASPEFKNENEYEYVNYKTQKRQPTKRFHKNNRS